MIVFRRNNNKLCLALDIYCPCYLIEICQIGPAILTLVKREAWDVLFIIMMISCPDQVRVDQELRENTFEEIKQNRPEINNIIKKMLEYKWFKSEEQNRDVGFSACLDYVLEKNEQLNL